MCNGSDVKVQVESGDVLCVRQQGESVIGLLQVNDIGWNLCDREIITILIEFGMGCNLDLHGFQVTPQDVLSCARCMAKENVFAGVGFWFVITFARSTLNIQTF